MQTIISQENTSYKRLAYILIVIGVLLSLDSYYKISTFLNLWPILVLILGVGFVGIFSKGRKISSTYLVIGIYLILFSFLALFCNFTSWSIISLYWPIFITILGIVFIATFIYKKTNRIMLFFGVLLIFLSLYFFVIFSVGNDSWWIIFVLVGLSILLSRIKKWQNLQFFL